MARIDAIVLGAGIVGTAVALHLAKRGLAVALVDRRGPGEETSYGNTGVIEGNTVFPAAFPARFSALVRVAVKRATEANYHPAYLPHMLCVLCSRRLSPNMRPCSRNQAPRDICVRRAGSNSIAVTKAWPRSNVNCQWPTNSVFPIAASTRTAPRRWSRPFLRSC